MLKDAREVLVFDATRQVLYSNVGDFDPHELPALAKAFVEREEAMRRGLTLKVGSIRRPRDSDAVRTLRQRLDPRTQAGIADASDLPSNPHRTLSNTTHNPFAFCLSFGNRTHTLSPAHIFRGSATKSIGTTCL